MNKQSLEEIKKEPKMVKIYVSIKDFERLRHSAKVANPDEFIGDLQVLTNSNLARGQFYTEDEEGNWYLGGDPGRIIIGRMSYNPAPYIEEKDRIFKGGYLRHQLLNNREVGVMPIMAA